MTSSVRSVLAVLGAITLALVGLVTLLLIGVLVGPAAFATGLVLAALPVPIYLALALWIDRFEPEPPRMLAWTFFWGASAATLIALIVNSVGQELVAANFGTDVGEIYGGSVSAPVVEESAKAVALFGVYRWRRDEFDGVLDGLVYAAMVGLGFAMTENVLYYGTAAAEDGDVPAEAVFFMRGVISPFAHPVFTAMMGIGLGLAVLTPSRWRRALYVAGGLLGAMLLHSAWNTSANDGVAFLGVYFLIMVPVFVALIVTVIVTRKRETRMVREYLQPEAAGGVLPPSEVAALAHLRTRRDDLKQAKRTGGRDARRRRAAYHEAATALAFHRNRMRRGVAGEPAVAQRREHDLRARLLELRGTPAAPPANWYPDPYGQARLRYWDGQQWTSHTAA